MPSGLPALGTVQEDYPLHLRFDTPQPNPGSFLSQWSPLVNLYGHRAGVGTPTPWGTPIVTGLQKQALQDVGGQTGATVTFAATTVTDTAKAWVVNQWTNFLVWSPNGTNGNPTYALVTSNTATVLTASAGWSNGTPTGTLYMIGPFRDVGPTADKSASGIGATVSYAATTLTDTAKGWVTNFWAGTRIITATGKFGVAASNTATIITLSAAGWNGGTPAAAEGYSLGQGVHLDSWWATLRQRGNTDNW